MVSTLYMSRWGGGARNWRGFVEEEDGKKKEGYGPRKKSFFTQIVKGHLRTTVRIGVQLKPQQCELELHIFH